MSRNRCQAVGAVSCLTRAIAVLLLAIGVFTSAATAGAVPRHLTPRREKAEDYHWVATWTSMPQLVETSNLPPAPFASTDALFVNATLRQTFQASIGTERIRLQISNIFGGSPLVINAASVALPVNGAAGVGAIIPGSSVDLSFNNGSASVTIEPGEAILTDAVDFAVEPQSNLAVSLFLESGTDVEITGHPGSRTTSWMGFGDQTTAESISEGSTLHWYFVSVVEAWSPPSTSALVIIGDSITDGRGSTNDKNDRWPNFLLSRMQAAGLDISVNNQAAGGNAILKGGLGPPLLQRYERDIFGVAGVSSVIIFEGVNDIGVSPTDVATQDKLAADLIAALTKIATESSARGLKVFGATITPFSGSGQSYSHPNREQTRLAVNDWILTTDVYDAVFDFASIVADPDDPSKLLAEYDSSGDHLHPNVVAFEAMAASIPLDIFE